MVRSELHIQGRVLGGLLCNALLPQLGLPGRGSAEFNAGRLLGVPLELTPVEGRGWQRGRAEGEVGRDATQPRRGLSARRFCRSSPVGPRRLGLWTPTLIGR